VATTNSDKIASAENSIIRAHGLINDVISSKRSLQNHTRQRCYQLKKYTQQLEKLLDELSSPENEEDLVDYSEISTSYSGKTIVNTYSHAFKNCTNCSFGVIEFGIFASLTNEWFSARFTPEIRNPKFKYKADRISRWLDIMIIAFGAYAHEGTVDTYQDMMHEWIQQISSDFSEIWPMPYFITSFEDSVYTNDYTPEAILLERLYKPHVYDRNFYHHMLDSVEKTVIFYQPDLKSLSNIDLIKHSNVTVTSSFNS